LAASERARENVAKFLCLGNGERAGIFRYRRGHEDRRINVADEYIEQQLRKERVKRREG